MSDERFQLFFKRNKDDIARKIGFGCLEPADCADEAETILRRRGEPGASWCELRLRGEAHTLVFYMEDETFGVWNTDDARWPIFYSGDTGDGQMLEGNPFADDDDEITEEDGDESGFGDEDEDSEVEDLGGGEDDEDEEEDDAESEEEDREDEEDDSDDDADDDSPDEIETVDEDDDDGDEDSESEDGDPEPGEVEEEDEMPRLKLFAKLKGPLGWRKRAETEELNEFNHFEMIVGILDPEAEKTKDQERDQLVRAMFVESDTVRKFGLFHVELPDGVDFVQDENDPKCWNATIPYDPEGK